MAVFTFSQEDINRSKLLEPGLWYNVEVTNVEEALSRKGDSMNTFVYMKVIDGPFTGALLTRTFNEKAPGAAIPFIEALGYEVKPGVDYNLSNAIGRKLRVFVNHVEREGRILNNVADFRPLD